MKTICFIQIVCSKYFFMNNTIIKCTVESFYNIMMNVMGQHKERCPKTWQDICYIQTFIIAGVGSFMLLNDTWSQ